MIKIASLITFSVFILAVQITSAVENDKNYHVGVQLIGVGSNYMATMQGLNFKYSVTDEIRLGIEYKKAAAIFNEVDRNWLDKESNSISYSQFLGSSFFIKAQIDFRADRLRQNATSSNPNNFYEFSAKSVALGLLIGNEFKISNNFSINCEWIGVAIPLSSQIDYETKGSSFNTDDFETEKKNYTTRIVGYLLNASVVYSF